MIHPHEPGEDILRLQFGRDGLERGTRAREGQRAGAVEGRDAHRAVMAGDERQRFFFGEAHRQHRPLATRAFMHQPRAQHDHPRGLLQAEDSGDARRRDFADAVADDGGGRDPQGFPKFRERHLHGENRGLRDLGLLQFRGRFVAAQFLEQGESRIRAHGRGTSLHRPAEHRLVAA